MNRILMNRNTSGAPEDIVVAHLVSGRWRLLVKPCSSLLFAAQTPPRGRLPLNSLAEMR